MLEVLVAVETAALFIGFPRVPLPGFATGAGIYDAGNACFHPGE